MRPLSHGNAGEHRRALRMMDYTNSNRTFQTNRHLNDPIQFVYAIGIHLTTMILLSYYERDFKNYWNFAMLDLMVTQCPS